MRKLIDLSIKVGTITGVKGKGGSGRTTLLELIRGDIEPTSGRVTIGGVSTMEPNFQAIRPCIAYVGAAPVMFSGTIMENLTVFSPEKRDFARKMSQLFGLETTINLLPDGYETELGRGIGDDLPMSIAQQVNIVRALTNRPRVLALDEANMVRRGRGARVDTCARNAARSFDCNRRNTPSIPAGPLRSFDSR